MCNTRVGTIFKYDGPNYKKKKLHVQTFLWNMAECTEQRGPSIYLTQPMGTAGSSSICARGYELTARHQSQNSLSEFFCCHFEII